LLGEIPCGFNRLLARPLRVNIFDRDVWCLDLPSLIHTKRAAGRPRDLEAIAEPEAIAEEQARRVRGGPS
jgi:hypothetical protein